MSPDDIARILAPFLLGFAGGLGFGGFIALLYRGMWLRASAEKEQG